MRLRSCRRSPLTGSVTASCRPSAEITPDVTLFVNVPSGLPITIAVWPGLSSLESPIRAAGRSCGVDLDDRQVGQRVDAVDRAGQPPPVLELDGDLRRVNDNVAIGQDPAVAAS